MALCIGEARWRKSGGVRGELFDLAIYVIPAGIIGGRLYHVFSTPELYFGVHGRFINAFKIWEGGMGIWGAVAVQRHAKTAKQHLATIEQRDELGDRSQM